jgi:SAM-dependent methyltransferase
MTVPDDVLGFYESGAEADRLRAGEGALELLRTQELLARFLPAGARVADVGGAAGHYAAWLADEGHDVDLVDPAPSQVEAARERAGDPPRFRAHVGHALALDFADDTFDAVLLLGPLYHLPDRDDRIAALQEARRICRPGGVVVGAGITRFAPLLNVVASGTVADDSIWTNVQDETRTGRRVPAQRRNSPFPDAWFHLPEELAVEFGRAGIALELLAGVEGLGRFVPDLDGWLADPQRRERLLEIARLTETDPHVMAVSFHVLAVGRVA